MNKDSKDTLVYILGRLTLSCRCRCRSVVFVFVCPTTSSSWNPKTTTVENRFPSRTVRCVWEWRQARGEASATTNLEISSKGGRFSSSVSGSLFIHTPRGSLTLPQFPAVCVRRSVSRAACGRRDVVYLSFLYRKHVLCYE